MLYESKILTLRTIGYSWYVFMDIVVWAQEAVFIHIWTAWNRFHAGVLFGWSSPYKGDSTRFSEVASGNPTSTCIPRVDG